MRLQARNGRLFNPQGETKVACLPRPKKSPKKRVFHPKIAIDLTKTGAASNIDAMNTLTRKQREIAEREEMFLDVSRKLLIEQGYAAFTMDQLAEATEFSKGVVYQHFKSKEDVITALAVQSMQRRIAWFRRAVAFDGRSREKMMAIGVAEELFVRNHAHHFHMEQIIKMAQLSERASDERSEKLLDHERACFGTVMSVVQLAVEAGDMTLESPEKAADVVLGLWSMNFGTYLLMQTSQLLLNGNGIASPYEGVRANCHAMLDGYGWKPLMREWDYPKTYTRILHEVFPEEALAARLS
jgi:AcrR family transcriptional regulator